MTETSGSAQDTLNFGRRLAARLGPGSVVALRGVLGAGKTTLVKGIARGLGIKEEITSPTFTIISIYESTPPLNHVDLYRLDREGELEDLGVEELLYGSGITVIEWPEKAASMLPDGTIFIDIVLREDGTREINTTRNET
jgi:tRNA threonylcarbamoyladenosine biosynthesis protein TsaE